MWLGSSWLRALWADVHARAERTLIPPKVLIEALSASGVGILISQGKIFEARSISEITIKTASKPKLVTFWGSNRASSYEPSQPGWLGFRDLASPLALSFLKISISVTGPARLLTWTHRDFYEGKISETEPARLTWLTWRGPLLLLLKFIVCLFLDLWVFTIQDKGFHSVHIALLSVISYIHPSYF